MTIVHVGFPKAASSSLQYDVFPRLKSHRYFNPIGYVGHGDIEADRPNYELLRLMNEGNETWDPAPIRRLFESAAREGKEVIVSSEGFTGFDGNIGLRAERAIEVFSADGPPKILLVIRQQFDAMRSFYKQNGFKTHLVPNWLDHIEWKKWLWHQMLPGHRYSSLLPQMKYADVVEYYEKLVGTESVRVLVFEQLKEDPAGFAAALATFIGADAKEVLRLLSVPPKNVGPKVAAQRALPFIPATLLRRRDPMDFGDYAPQLAEAFAPGNRRIAEKFNLPLDQYGYPL